MEESVARKRQLQYRSDRIRNAALELFCKNGIEGTSIEVVAKQARVGPATVYRYFETKTELAVESAALCWQKISEKYLGVLKTKTYMESSGKEQLAKIMELLKKIFREEGEFFKFLQEFDVFVLKNHITQERLKEYEAEILNLKPYVTEALEKGRADGTLFFSYTVDEVYFSMTHTILSLMQKLAAHGKIISSDEWIGAGRQVDIACEILLRGLSAQQENR